jgi:hypothetical protein
VRLNAPPTTSPSLRHNAMGGLLRAKRKGRRHRRPRIVWQRCALYLPTVTVKSQQRGMARQKRKRGRSRAGSQGTLTIINATPPCSDSQRKRPACAGRGVLQGNANVTRSALISQAPSQRPLLTLMICYVNVALRTVAAVTPLDGRAPGPGSRCPTSAESRAAPRRARGTVVAG